MTFREFWEKLEPYQKVTLVLSCILVIFAGIQVCRPLFDSFSRDPSSPVTSPSLTPTTVIQPILSPPQTQPQQNPIIHNLTPDKKSGQIIGTDITWTVYATDLNNDAISYRFLLKGPQDDQPEVQQGWSTMNTWIWTTSKYDNGSYEVKCQVRDNNEGSSDYDTESIYRDFRLIKVDCSGTDFECILGKGWEFFKKGEFESALICFNRSVELDPQSAWAWSARGFAFDRLDRLEESYNSFQKSVDISPDIPATWVGIGWIYQKWGRSEDAIKAFDISIEKSEKSNDKVTWCDANHGKYFALNATARYAEAAELKKMIEEYCWKF